jgi:hypothetical protein
MVVPLPLVEGWIGIANIGRPAWQAVYHAATIHHVVLPFGLVAIFAAQLGAAGRLGVAAFALAALGNALVGGIGIVQVTVLPALAAHPDGQGALDCLPFYLPATQSAAGFLDAACASWRFGVLDTWFVVAWLTLSTGALLLGAAIVVARVLPRPSGVLIVLGHLALVVGALLGRPEAVGVYGLAIAGAGYAWSGWALARGAHGQLPGKRHGAETAPARQRPS